MKNDSFDISSLKALKFGFFFGIGMALGKFTTAVIGGKVAIATAGKALKKNGTKTMDDIIDELKTLSQKEQKEFEDLLK